MTEATQTSQNPLGHDVPVIPRNIDFGLDDVDYNWHGKGPGVSNLMNALSLLFPEGEEFFVDSARNFVNEIEDPELKKEVRGFMTQEMIHTREHVAYNDMLKRSGIDTDKLEAQLKRDLDRGRKMLPKKYQLAITVFLEHWTASLAQMLLEHPETIENSHPKMQALWSWHAVEETEHKAVCFDLLRAVEPNDRKFYWLRIRPNIIGVLPFLGWIAYFYIQCMRQTGHAWDFKEHFKTIKFMWFTPGLFGRMIPMWADFFRKDFHPWDHDNRDQIAKWDAETENDTKAIPPRFGVEAATPAAAA
ncbi:MAG: metal-dependent hydrolase [Alphaproteobacteria bacterium]